MVWYGMAWHGMVWYGMVRYAVYQCSPDGCGHSCESTEL